jgi:predicted RNA-binding Zn ribbon-like protein
MQREDLLTGRVQSGGREPAEGDLRLIQDFVNTVDREHGGEVFDSPAGLEEWLALRELPGAPVGAGGLERALALREALRTLLLANNGGPDSPEAAETLAAAGRAAALTPVFGAAGPALEPQADGLDATLGRLVAIAFAAMLDGRWPRLKACPREVCGWVFQDRSTANRGTWCSMRICGNRVKANAYYRRRTRGD